MRIVILNWADGENDPFTYFCEQLRSRLQALGHDAAVLRLDGNTGLVLADLHQRIGLDFAICWQGLGSQLRLTGSTQTVWEMLDLPLLSFHSDQPAYNPANHQQPSKHLFNIYPSHAFATDANTLIPREWPAIVEILPNFFAAPEGETPAFEGDFFVFPKNITPVEVMKARWRERLERNTAELLCLGADRIAEQFRRDHRINHHDVILDLLPAPMSELVRTGRVDPATAKTVFGIKRELDPVYRNTVSGFIIDALAHVPIRVNGRGWDLYAARNNPHHTFQEFGSLADGEYQFRSMYGILDAAPGADLLHDRVARAMVRGTGFLSSVAFRHGEPIYEEFRPLFFSGDADELAARAEAVMADPETHRARVRMFNEVYDAVFPFGDFVRRLVGHMQARGFLLPRISP